ncbi:hypothetical protein AAG570_014147 [Ranatra chinensis]|uniref:Reverse transcriptase domain-containing protein n=1 Tax=Ranatra chinensis TaxID=642074 RepID=A0ABD0XRY2_9HEMI
MERPDTVWSSILGNKRTRTERYPLLRLNDMLDRMNGTNVFSIVDLKAGYHQNRKHPGDIEKTAFQFERGKYEYLRMPFGLKTAPTTFQRLMDEFLEGLDPDAIQIYDIVVFSESAEEHGEHLGQLLERLREFGLRASEEKSSFFRDKLKFMGHMVSARGVATNDSEVDAIKRLPISKDPKEFKSFQGLVRYYRKFILNLADRLADQTIKKGRKVEDGEDRSIAFESRKLTDAEARYPAIERELLGVVWGVQQFRPYHWGRMFQVRTDHKPLVWVDRLKKNSARVTQWKETLAAYDFDIGHARGAENVVADCLSRLINATGVWEDQEMLTEILAQETPRAEAQQLSWDRTLLQGPGNGDRAGVTVCHDRYARPQTWTVTIGWTASDDDVLTQLKTFMLDDATYYVYTARPQDRDRLDRLSYIAVKKNLLAFSLAFYRRKEMLEYNFPGKNPVEIMQERGSAKNSCGG